MAEASTIPFSGVRVMLESATTPNTFVAPCGLTQRSVTFSKETTDSVVPDCTDEDAAAWPQRDVVSKSVSISGEGVLARESLPRWRAAWESDEPVKARVELSGTAAQGGGAWTGLFHLTSKAFDATKGERCKLQVEMQSTGAVTFTAAA